MKNAWVASRQILFGLLLAAGIAAMGLGFGPLADSNRFLGVAAGIGGIALLVAVFIWLPGSAKREMESAQQSAVTRGEKIAEYVMRTGQSFYVREGSLLPVAIVLTLAAAIACYSDFKAPSLGSHVSGGLMALGAIYAWLSEIPRKRAPLISFSRDGVETAPYGLLQWDAVEHMNLVRNTERALTYTLELQVSCSDELLARAQSGGQSRRHSTCALSGNVLRFSLSAEEAHELHRLALTLWQRRTPRL